MLYLRVVGYYGLLKAVVGKILGRTFYYDLTMSGLRHSVRLRIPTSDVPTYEQVYLRKEYDFAVKSQPLVIIDAGANVGLASIYFANKYPSAKIIAVEPEDSNFELLRWNVAKYPNVLAVQAAIWSENKEIELVDPGLGKWSFMTRDSRAAVAASHGSCHEVTAVTIDRLMRDHDLEKIDILKVDIEGAEMEVFEDPSAWIGKVQAIVVELHERLKPGCEKCFYSHAKGFHDEWRQGENVYLSKHGYISRHGVESESRSN